MYELTTTTGHTYFVKPIGNNEFKCITMGHIFAPFQIRKLRARK